MPLPPFDSFSRVWVEKTKSSHGHGGAGWEFGSCLWSPTLSKAETKIYKNMTEVTDGDLVLHFYEDTPFGREEDHYFCGVSRIDGNAVVRTDEPPLPGEWAGRPGYYRASLRGFVPFESPIALGAFAHRYSSEIIALIEPNSDLPFINYKGAARLAQGKYLSRCNKALFDLLSACIIDEVRPIETVVVGGQSPSSDPPKAKQPFDYEGYVEGQRSRREVNFFSRNPRLVEDAKKFYKCKCLACDFDFAAVYPEIGMNFIEVHHLDPLSERANADAKKLTRIDHVATLCANCHRMIHRLIRKLKRGVPIDEFRGYLSRHATTN